MARSTGARSEGREGAQRNRGGHGLRVRQPLQACTGCVTRAGCLTFLSLVLLKWTDERTHASQSQPCVVRARVQAAFPLAGLTLGPARC